MKTIADLETITLIIPSLMRTWRLVRTLTSLMGPITLGSVKAMVITEDPETQHICQRLPVTLIEEGGTPVEKWNRGAQLADTEWIGLAADDLVFERDWLDVVRATPNQGFIGLNEGIPWTDYVGHWVCTKTLCEQVLGGVLMPPPYKIWWCDQEVCTKVKSAGRYARTERVVLRHEIPAFNRTIDPETYDRTQPWKREDALTFRNRKEAGWPVVWEPMVYGNREAVTSA